MCPASSPRSNDKAVFDLFFRKNPFAGEFTIFAGLEDCLRYLSSFRFIEDDIAFLRKQFPSSTEPAFFEYLQALDTSEVKLYALDEGSAVFPKVPMMRLEGPLGITQLLETTLLVLVNFASLVTTNTVRYRIAAAEKLFYEFGLRRAQGPDGGMTASRFAYIGGVDATSNVLAGQLFGIPVIGTFAHSFVTSFKSADEVTDALPFADGSGTCANFMQLVQAQYALLSECFQKNGRTALDTHQGELAAFSAYALSFPRSFVALIDTYDVLRSGVLNYCVVALALRACKYAAKGVRLDSGDLAYQSRECRHVFTYIADKMAAPELLGSIIICSNDINEQTIYSLRSQENALDAFACGTHLVTCQMQPALGAVFKLVEINGQACIKLSADIEKVTIPGRKLCYRLYGKDGRPICDLLQLPDDKVPVAGEPVMCRHPFQESKRANVIPSRVESIHKLFWDGKLMEPQPTIEEIRSRVRHEWTSMRPDHVRALNPTPYKVSVSMRLYDFMHQLWMDSAPVGVLS